MGVLGSFRTVDCTIVVPATASISALDLNAGEVLLDSMRGPEVHARLNDGRIFARNCFTNLDLTVNRGTLALSYEWWEKEKFSAQADVGTGKRLGLVAQRSSASIFSPALRMERSQMISIISRSPRIPPHREMKIDQIVNGGGAATINVRVEKGNIKIAEANP